MGVVLGFGMNELRRVAASGPPRDERALYEADEHAWIERQTAALREGRLDDLDRSHLIEFLNDMTARDRRELENRLIVLLHLLLKVRFQPDQVSKSWRGAIREQQRQVRGILTAIPSLNAQASAFLERSYPHARLEAAEDTGLPLSTFPTESPWTVEDALAFAFPVRE